MIRPRILPRPLKPAWLGVLLVFALGAIVGAISWWPMFDRTKGPTSDGRYVFHQFEIGKAAILHFGEAPLWNPFDCRGIPMWDHPEAMVISPLVLLLVPLHTDVALYVWQILHLAAGFTGLWLLGRSELRLSRTASFVAASLYTVYAGAAAQYAGLHATLMGFYFLPSVLLLWRRAEHDVRDAIGLGALLAFMFYDGATYPLPYAALVLFAETLTRAWPLARLRRIVGHGLVAAVTAAGLAAARLLPVARRLTQGKRDIPADIDHLLHARSLWAMFTKREPNGFTVLPDQQYWWHEYNVYLGMAGLLVAAIGLAFAVRRYRWTVVTSALVFLLMAGHFAWWAPWSLLHAHVFPFQALRVPSRFRHVLMIFVCAWIGLAIDRFPGLLVRLTGRRAMAEGARTLLLAMGVVAATDTMLFARSIVELRYAGEAPKPEAASPRFYYGGDGLAPDWMNQPSQNRAWLGCRAEFSFHAHAPLWEGDVPQARALDDALRIVSSSRTNNTFHVVVEASRPGRVLLNSAYDREFYASVGMVMNHFDLLSVDVPVGRHEIRVAYWPTLLVPGLAITAASTAAVVAFLVFARRRAERTVHRACGAVPSSLDPGDAASASDALTRESARARAPTFPWENRTT